MASATLQTFLLRELEELQLRAVLQLLSKEILLHSLSVSVPEEEARATDFMKGFSPIKDSMTSV